MRAALPGSAMPRLVSLALVAGLLSALLHLSTEWGILGAVVFSLAAPFAVFAAGLGLGLNGAIVAATVATTFIAAVAGFPRAGLYAATDAVLVLILVRYALLNRTTPEGGLEWYPPGQLLAWLTLYAVVAFVALTLVWGPENLQTGVSGYVDSFRRMLAEASRESPAMDRMLAGLKRVLPFLVVAWWLIIMAANGVLAQKFLVRTGHALRPSPDLTTTAPPGWVLSAAVAAAAVALVGSGWIGFMATNVALILCVPYFLTGLAVVHAVSVRWNGRKAILVALYLLLFLFGWPLIVVTGLGMVDHWIGLRRRYAGPGPGNERNE